MTRGELLFGCAHDMVLDSVSLHPESRAISSSYYSLTYDELGKAAAMLATSLRERGIGLEKLVALPAVRSPSTIVAMLATLMAGGAYMPFDPTMPRARVEETCSRLGAHLILEPTSLAERPVTAMYALTVVDSAPANVDERRRILPANLAYVILTSGSTGVPKAVGVEHRNLVASTLARNAFNGLRRSVHLLSTQSFSFDASVYDIYWTLSVGGELIIATEDELVDPIALGQLMRRHSVTYLNCTPSMYSMILEAVDREAMQTVRHVTVGGESCPPSVVRLHYDRLPDAQLINDYGPSECTVWATRFATLNRLYEAVPIGEPIPGTDVYVLDNSGNQATPGSTGELYIAGCGVARGYLGDPQQTALSFVPDGTSGRRGDRLYRSGDLVHEAHGQLIFLGRKDDEAKVRGYRINLAGISYLLLQRPDVLEAAVVVIGSGIGARLMAFLVTDAQVGELSSNHIIGYLRSRIPAYAIPQSIRILAQMPRNSHGKIDRERLKLMGKDYVAASDQVHTRARPVSVDAVREALEATLGISSIDPQSDLFELGLTSLHIAKLVGEFGRSYGVRMRAAKIFETPTVDGITNSVNEHLDPQHRLDNTHWLDTEIDA